MGTSTCFPSDELFKLLTFLNPSLRGTILYSTEIDIVKNKKVCREKVREKRLEKRGYLSENVKPEIKRVQSVSGAELPKKVQKQNDCSEVVLVLSSSSNTLSYEGQKS